MIEIRVLAEALGDSATSGSIILWMYPDGAFVRHGDVIAEFLVDKATLEIQAPASGILHIKLQPEVPASAGTLLALIEPTA